MKFTNLTDTTVDLLVKGDPKDGVPQTDSIGPRETKEVSADPETPTVKALLEFGVLKAEGGKAAAKAKE